MSTVYKVFEFKDGCRVHCEIPVCYIVVNGNENKYDVLASELARLGNGSAPHGFGVEEIDNIEAEACRIRSTVASLQDLHQVLSRHLQTVDNNHN